MAARPAAGHEDRDSCPGHMSATIRLVLAAGIAFGRYLSEYSFTVNSQTHICRLALGHGSHALSVPYLKAKGDPDA